MSSMAMILLGLKPPPGSGTPPPPQADPPTKPPTEDTPDPEPKPEPEESSAADTPDPEPKPEPEESSAADTPDPYPEPKPEDSSAADTPEAEPEAKPEPEPKESSAEDTPEAEPEAKPEPKESSTVDPTADPPKSTYTGPLMSGIVFAAEGKDTDFTVMVEDPDYQHTLFLFNDNFDHRLKHNEGGGNGKMRIYNEFGFRADKAEKSGSPWFGKPRAVGVPFGPLVENWPAIENRERGKLLPLLKWKYGNYPDNNFTFEQYIAEAVTRLRALLDTYNYDRILFSGNKGDPTQLDFATFKNYLNVGDFKGVAQAVQAFDDKVVKVIDAEYKRNADGFLKPKPPPPLIDNVPFKKETQSFMDWVYQDKFKNVLFIFNDSFDFIDSPEKAEGRQAVRQFNEPGFRAARINDPASVAAGPWFGKPRAAGIPFGPYSPPYDRYKPMPNHWNYVKRPKESFLQWTFTKTDDTGNETTATFESYLKDAVARLETLLKTYKYNVIAYISDPDTSAIDLETYRFGLAGDGIAEAQAYFKANVIDVIKNNYKRNDDGFIVKRAA